MNRIKLKSDFTEGGTSLLFSLKQILSAHSNYRH